jgi:hypothetical protein
MLQYCAAVLQNDRGMPAGSQQAVGKCVLWLVRRTLVILLSDHDHDDHQSSCMVSRFGGVSPHSGFFLHQPLPCANTSHDLM